ESREPALPRETRARREHLLERDMDDRVVGILQVDEVRALERAAERAPELRLQCGHAVVAAVLARVNAIAGKPSGEPLVAPRDRLTSRVGGERRGGPAHSAVRHPGGLHGALPPTR